MGDRSPKDKAKKKKQVDAKEHQKKLLHIRQNQGQQDRNEHHQQAPPADEYKKAG